MADFDLEVILPGIAEIYERGRELKYHNRLGQIKTIKAFVDEDFFETPSAYESTVQERTIVITMMLADVPNIGRGDTLVDESRGITYEVVADVPEQTTEFEKAVAAK